MEKSKYKIISLLNELKSLFYEMRYDLPKKTYQINLSLYKDKVVLDNDIKVDFSDLSKSKFMYIDYESLSNLLHYKNSISKNFSMTINFESELEIDGYSSPVKEYIYSSDYSDCSPNDLIFYPVMNKEESSFVKKTGISSDSGIWLSLFFEIKNNKVSVSLERKEFNSKVGSVITKIPDYYNFYNELLSLLDSKDGHQLSFEGLEDYQDTFSQRNILEEFKKSYKEIVENNYFESFLSTAIGKIDYSFYLFTDKDTNANISHALVFEHEGNSFNWNSYSKLNKNKITIPVVHSYIDHSWSVSKVNFSKSINGIASRTIKDKSEILESVAMLLFDFTKDSLSDNVFMKPYTKFKIFLSKGNITKIETDWRNVYGLNENDEVVFQLSYNDEHYINDLEIFKKGLNNLINDFYK